MSIVFGTIPDMLFVHSLFTIATPSALVPLKPAALSAPTTSVITARHGEQPSTEKPE